MRENIGSVAAMRERDHSVLHRRSGEITVLTTEEAKDAAETVKKLRKFVGL